MPNTTTYSFLAVTATLDGRRVQGYFEGDDAVMVEHGSDISTTLIGADGDGIHSISADRSARITLKLQHTSPTHAQLLQKLARTRAGRPVPFSFDVIDGATREGGTAEKCVIQQAPADSKGRSATVRTWVLSTVDWKPNVTFGEV